MNQEAISLRELNSQVCNAIQHAFHYPVWIIAEISEMHTASNGHCYLEFIEKDPQNDDIIARARGNIWANRYRLIAAGFEQFTGQRLQAGIRVLIMVQVQMHEVYGYSLSVLDIDPSFTLGEMARRRQEIINRLEREGLTDMNKGISVPCPAQRIAIISADNAAGYGDFCRQLADNEWGVKFYTHLFPAIMQGQQAEASIIAALERIYKHRDLFDIVVIIRGGGATADLNCFDSYELAVNIANFPLPIITGIGHDRDSTVIDVVAHTSVKTPTATAALLIDWAGLEVRSIELYRQTLLNAPAQCLQQAHTAMYQTCSRLQASRRYIDAHLFELKLIKANIGQLARTRLTEEQMQIRQYHNIVEMANPKKTLRRGFAIASINGKTLRKASEATPGSHITIQLAEGILEAVIDKTTTTDCPDL